MYVVGEMGDFVLFSEWFVPQTLHPSLNGTVESVVKRLVQKPIKKHHPSLETNNKMSLFLDPTVTKKKKRQEASTKAVKAADAQSTNWICDSNRWTLMLLDMLESRTSLNWFIYRCSKRSKKESHSLLVAKYKWKKEKKLLQLSIKDLEQKQLVAVCCTGKPAQYFIHPRAMDKPLWNLDSYHVSTSSTTSKQKCYGLDVCVIDKLIQSHGVYDVIFQDRYKVWTRLVLIPFRWKGRTDCWSVRVKYNRDESKSTMDLTSLKVDQVQWSLDPILRIVFFTSDALYSEYGVSFFCEKEEKEEQEEDDSNPRLVESVLEMVHRGETAYSLSTSSSDTFSSSVSHVWSGTEIVQLAQHLSQSFGLKRMHVHDASFYTMTDHERKESRPISSRLIRAVAGKLPHYHAFGFRPESLQSFRSIRHLYVIARHKLFVEHLIEALGTIYKDGWISSMFPILVDLPSKTLCLDWARWAPNEYARFWIWYDENEDRFLKHASKTFFVRFCKRVLSLPCFLEQWA